MTRQLLQSRELPPMADARAALADLVTELQTDGWQPEGDGKCGSLFIYRGDERREVGVQFRDPNDLLGGPAP